MNISKEKINALDLEQAKKLCAQNKIDVKEDITLLEIRTLIFNASDGVTKVKKHKRLGVYKNCIVHLTRHAQQNTSVFVSINIDTFEFQPEAEIELPAGVIEFLRGATTVEHYFDKSGTSENGNKGVHASRDVKKYIVELI